MDTAEFARFSNDGATNAKGCVDDTAAVFPHDDRIDVVEVFASLLRRWRMIAVVTIGSAAFALGVSLVLPVWYQSSAQIIPPQQDNGFVGAMLGDIGGLSGLAGDLVGGRSTTDLYVSMLHSETVKDAVIDRFKLLDVYGMKYRLDAYRTLDDRTSISAGKKDGVITITAEDHDPKRAAALANAFVEELKVLTVKLNITGAGTNRGFLEEQLVEARTNLSKAEEALTVFQSRNKTIDVPEQAKVSIAAVAEMNALLAGQEVQLATMRRGLTDESADVRNLKTSIEGLRHQISQLEGHGSGTVPSVGSIPALGKEYVRLMREFKIQETLVELLTKQFEMAKLNEAKDTSSIQVLQQARVPDKRAKPKRAQIVFLAAAVGCFVSLLGALLLAYFERMPPQERARWSQLRPRRHRAEE